MSAKIIVEGAAKGPDSKNLQVQLREAFGKLLIEGRVLKRPTFVAAGSRSNAFKLFKTAYQFAGHDDFIALLVDSEEPVVDIEQPWNHLKQRQGDNWDRPAGAVDDQVLLMTTCMETWIASDRETLRKHYGSVLQENALPALQDMETRDRHVVQDSLVRATRNCTNTFSKGKRSFEILAKLNPAELRIHLPSFARCERILQARL